ncbi:hypothetical protein D3C72_2542610 [compost metagenome]
MEPRHGDIERILIATQRLGSHYPTGQLTVQIRHQRIAQLLIQRARPQIVICDHVLHVAGLIYHAVTSE